MLSTSTPAVALKTRAFIEMTRPDGSIVRVPVAAATARRIASTGKRKGKATPTRSQLSDLMSTYGAAHQSVIIAAHQEAFADAAAKLRELSIDDVNTHLDNLEAASDLRRTLVTEDSPFGDEDFAAYDTDGDALQRNSTATVQFLTTTALANALSKMADDGEIHRIPTGRMNKAGEPVYMKGYYSAFPAQQVSAKTAKNNAAAEHEDSEVDEYEVDDTDEDDSPVAGHQADYDNSPAESPAEGGRQCPVDADTPVAKPAKGKVSRKR